MMDVLTLENAVKVATRHFGVDPVIAEQEFYQKCWFPETKGTPKDRLFGLLNDINPAEIASQIERDNLKKWCTRIQIEMIMALMEISGGEQERHWKKRLFMLRK